jgi:hypothetical protein
MTPERRARTIIAQLANYDYDFSEAINSKNVLMIADVIRAAIGQELIENDRLQAEAAALRARLDAVREALGPALEAEAGATPGPWHVYNDNGYWYIYGADDFQIHDRFNAGGNAEGQAMAEANRSLIAAAVNGVRQARAALEGEGQS